ncbi:MAG TPA: type II toxin-antitoxin system HicB family antitoxin [Gemmataceae bacterium]|jgi:predicted RNase H-like HicB family nuclease|nr:type II toxin-antitoxin system HicB family antitoxin [Gemmataceae bacterium]
MRYPVMIRRTRTGYSADVPDFPGCIAAAKTVESTRRSIAKAIGLHLELMRESGERIPAPTRRIHFSPADSDGEEFCTWVEVKSPESVLP